MKISIVLITNNRKEDILTTLGVLSNLSYKDYEIVVLDNGSVDGTVNAIRATFPMVNLLCLNKNYGIHARNIGVCESAGELVIMIDDDAHFGNGVCEEISLAFTKDPKIDVLALRVVNDKSNTIETLDFEMSAMYGSSDRRVWFDYHNCGVAFRKSVYLNAGGLRKDFNWGIGETEFAIRLLKLGVKIYGSPDIVVHHRVTPINRLTKRNCYLRARNQIVSYWLHFSVTDICKQVPVRYFWWFVDWCIRKGQFGAYFKGIVAGISMAYRLRRERCPIRGDLRSEYMAFYRRIERIRLRSRFVRYRNKLLMVVLSLLTR